MATRIVTLLPGVWTAVIVGPTDSVALVEKRDTGGMAWLAVSTDIHCCRARIA